MTDSPTDNQMKKKVLYLAGSPKDKFFFDLSLLYSKACFKCRDLDESKYEFIFAVVDLDRFWSFPKSLKDEDIFSSKKMLEKKAIDFLVSLNVSVMVSAMMCYEGMTRYRGIFEELNIPYIGNTMSTLNISMDKGLTKETLQKEKVSVPNAELLVKGVNEKPTNYIFPCVVKSCTEDNSVGVRLVKSPQQMEEALEHCFGLGDRVLVEEYIRGRELRAGIIEESDGSLFVLPKIEYFIPGEIRTLEDK